MRDPRVEQVLNTTADLAWEYLPTIPLSKINQQKSHSNQARIDRAIDPELVRQYKNDMLSGDQFPAPVLFVDGNEYTTSDGNHRTEAAKSAGKVTIDGYAVISDDPVIRQALTYEWNVLNGKAASDEDRDRHAAFLVAQGMSQKAVGEQMHMSARRIEEIVAEDAGHTRAMALGVKSPWAKIPSRAGKVRLHNDLLLDTVFAAAVKFVGKYELIGKDTKELTTEIKALRSETDQLALIAKRVKSAAAAIEAAKNAKRKGGGGGRNPKGMFEMHLAYIQKAVDNDFKSLIVPSLNDEEKKALRDYVLSVKARLAEAESLLRVG